jgi:hypothetical protein
MGEWQHHACTGHLQALLAEIEFEELGVFHPFLLLSINGYYILNHCNQTSS